MTGTSTSRAIRRPVNSSSGFAAVAALTPGLPGFVRQWSVGLRQSSLSEHLSPGRQSTSRATVKRQNVRWLIFAQRDYVIARIISGGQNGVDLGALRAAKSSGVPTGGTMPKGWLTLDGPRPEYAEEFGMTVLSYGGYAARTHKNVQDADFTLRIAQNLLSPGEICTMRAIESCCKPHANVRIRENAAPNDNEVLRDIEAAVTAIRRLGVSLGRLVILNIAGNLERTCPGIGDITFDVVKDLLRQLKGAP
jgi:Circularly permutated YpsA SLOG family